MYTYLTGPPVYLTVEVDGQFFDPTQIKAVTRYYPAEDIPTTLREKDRFRDCKAAIFLHGEEGSFPVRPTPTEVDQSIKEQVMRITGDG